jgi:hypothetical protein
VTGKRLNGVPFEAKSIELKSSEREELRQMSVARNLPAGDVLRARMILMLADGRSYAEIQERLQTTAPTIARWKKRFLCGGVAVCSHSVIRVRKRL